MMLFKCCTQYAENLEKSAVATGLEKVSFHSNPKEKQCQRMLSQTTTYILLLEQLKNKVVYSFFGHTFVI